jgi:hypothetical protein
MQRRNFIVAKAVERLWSGEEVIDVLWEEGLEVGDLERVETHTDGP